MTQEQSKLCDAHITEYREQVKQHREQILALTGAIQALERLQKEADDGHHADIQQSELRESEAPLEGD